MLTRRLAAALASSRGLFVVAVLAGSLTGLGFLGVGESNHTATARFSDADGLVTGNEVRVAGVQAGTVSSVTVGIDPSTGKQYAEVKFQVDAGHWPLHQGTMVSITPKGVLSNVFLGLTPGAITGPSLGDNPFFGADQTQSPVNLDEFSNVFNSDVTHSIRTQLQEGVLALGGAGAIDLNQTISYANPLTKDAIPVTDVLAQRSPQLDLLTFEFDTITGDLAREDASLRPLIVNLDTMLTALAAKEEDLKGTIVNGAAVFGELHAALGDSATQTALANFFRLSPNALTCTNALSLYLTPLIASVNPHVASLDVLLSEFVTATGYNTYQAPPGGSTIDTLRIDPSLTSIPAKENGGLQAEHGPGYEESGAKTITSPLSNGCNYVPGASTAVTP